MNFKKLILFFVISLAVYGGWRIPQTYATDKSPNVKYVPIIMFHYIRHVDEQKDEEGYNLSTEVTLFNKILQYLHNNDYHTVHIGDLLNGKIPSKPIALTFDDGYEDFYTNALPLLKKYGFTGTEAIISGHMDGQQYMSPNQVKSIEHDGIEILSHTVHHADMSKTPYPEDEAVKSKAALEKIIGGPVTGFVYPSGKYTDDTIRILIKAGYRFALTTHNSISDISKKPFELHRIRFDNRDGFKGFLNKLKT